MDGSRKLASMSAVAFAAYWSLRKYGGSVRIFGSSEYLAQHPSAKSELRMYMDDKNTSLQLLVHSRARLSILYCFRFVSLMFGDARTGIRCWHVWKIGRQAPVRSPEVVDHCHPFHFYVELIIYRYLIWIYISHPVAIGYHTPLVMQIIVAAVRLR